jgi:hypothetical protein
MPEIVRSLPERPLTQTEATAIANKDEIERMYHFTESVFDESLFDYSDTGDTTDAVVLILLLIDERLFLIKYEGNEWEKDLLDTDTSIDEFTVTGELMQRYGNDPDALNELL